MIQRIQTIFLLISLIAWGFLFLNPVVGFSSGSGGTWELFANGIKETAGGKMVMGTVPMLALYILIEALIMIAIFSYKRRALQLRVTIFTMLLEVLSYGLLALYIIQGKNQLNAVPGLLFFSVMPLIAGICSFLAFRGIRKDILLLKAQDRIR